MTSIAQVISRTVLTIHYVSINPRQFHYRKKQQQIFNLFNLHLLYVIYSIEQLMFERSQNQKKYDLLFNQKQTANFGETQDESFVAEVEAEKDYVHRLKNQRAKIENLSSKYDTLLTNLKSKDGQLKQKDKTIYNLESRCKTLNTTNQETTQFRQQNNSIKTENMTLQNAISELEENYTHLHGQFRSKQAVTSQKYEEMQNFNDQLMSKIRSLTIKYQEREQQFRDKYTELANNFQALKVQAKKEKEEFAQQSQLLRTGLLERDQQIKLLKTENECLQARINECEVYLNELSFQSEQKIQSLYMQKKNQLRYLKHQMEGLQQINCVLEKKCQKLKEETQAKEASLGQMAVSINQLEKKNSEAFFLLNQQTSQERTTLKQQLIQCQNYISKLERRITESVRRQQCLNSKLQKYESCLEAKRNLRAIEKEQLDRINYLLNLT